MKNSCPICQSDGRLIRPFATRKAEKLDLLECVACGQEFLHPFPSNDWLAEEYSQYYHKRQSGMVRAKTEYFKKLFLSLKLDFNGKKVLELGPGEGDAIVALKELYPKVSITAVERNEEANDLFKKMDCQYYNMFLEEYITSNVDQTKFDFILLFDVLEHLKSPVDVLKDLNAQKLEKDGKVIATFPVADSISRKMLGKVWPQYKVEHLNYFTSPSIELMSNKADLDIEKNEVLVKTLSLDYLLNVGKGFGPQAFKSFSHFLSNATPQPLRKLNLAMGYGEKLLVLRKR